MVFHLTDSDNYCHTALFAGTVEPSRMDISSGLAVD